MWIRSNVLYIKYYAYLITHWAQTILYNNCDITFLTVFILTHPVNFPCGRKPDSFHSESAVKVEPNNMYAYEHPHRHTKIMQYVYKHAYCLWAYYRVLVNILACSWAYQNPVRSWAHSYYIYIYIYTKIMEGHDLRGEWRLLWRVRHWIPVSVVFYVVWSFLVCHVRPASILKKRSKVGLKGRNH
jgi:hypothetical protein